MTATALPSTTQTPVPDGSSRDYSAHHSTVYADPRITDIDTAARYYGEHSTDNGHTWTPVDMPTGWDTVCGGHTQVEVAGALLSGWDVIADGTTRIIREWDGSLTRWTMVAPVSLTKDAVTLHDIATNTVWRRMSARDGERDVQICYTLGDVVQEYDTTDRDGHPYRIVFQIDAPMAFREPDAGAVYMFRLPTT